MFLPDERANAALDALYSGGGVSCWCSLSITEPELVGGVLTSILEPTGLDRVEVLPGDWEPAADRATQAVVQFPDPVDDLGVVVAWVLFDSEVGGVATDAGFPAKEMDLQAGSSDVTVTVRVESPADFYSL